MSAKLPVDQPMKVSEFRSHLNDAVTQVFQKDARILLEKSGIPVAAVVSMEDWKLLKNLDREREKDFEVIDQLREAFRGVSEEELWREGAKALAEVRAEKYGGPIDDVDDDYEHLK
jgi:prevent-host-death family protein